MNTTTDDLFGLIVSGPVRAVHTNEDGSWTVVPVIGAPLLLTGTQEAAAYVQRATASTGPAALAPAVLTMPAPAYDDEPEAGCGCIPAAARPRSAQQESDLMQARAVAAALGDLGISPSRRTAAYDDEHQAAAVRVASTHGLYTLHIPPVQRQYPVMRDGRRDGVIGARRIPAVRDSMVATLYAAYLRDRGAL
ncbi:hypothetical protein [Streptomyces sp. NPDC002913]